MINVTIRLSTIADLPRIMEIEQEAFPIDAYDQNLFAQRYRDCSGGFVVAEYERRIVAYLIGCISGAKGKIDSMATDAAYRCQGTGKQLMYWILEYFRRKGVRFVELEVRKTNVAAINLYESLGFHFTGQLLAGYYRDGADAHVMAKSLSDLRSG